MFQSEEHQAFWSYMDFLMLIVCGISCWSVLERVHVWRLPNKNCMQVWYMSFWQHFVSSHIHCIPESAGVGILLSFIFACSMYKWASFSFNIWHIRHICEMQVFLHLLYILFPQDWSFSHIWYLVHTCELRSFHIRHTPDTHEIWVCHLYRIHVYTVH